MANDNQAQDQHKDSAKSSKGVLKEALGAATGDRHVEAKGRVEQKIADPQAPERDESDETVGEEERAVRAAHKEIPTGDGDESGPLGT
jgi:uncharacterized protein YjbJ (UPF0337 family)